ncbi:hypothetical protein ACFYXQ_46875 [Nocardia jiangxiensis]|uniref:Uncharacterized protein n=1 Tax=Nocardia jiangxiensis TaxID=282685 RepID=A0ABW6SGC3_9NOCA
MKRTVAKIALAQSCYGHFYIEHNRGHHAHVATPEDPASTMAAQAPIVSRVQRMCEEVRVEHRFDESLVRASTVGSRRDLELAFVLDADTSRRAVGFFDDIRAEIQQRLTALGYHHSTSVMFTAQRGWMHWSR